MKAILEMASKIIRELESEKIDKNTITMQKSLEKLEEFVEYHVKKTYTSHSFCSNFIV